MLSATIPAYSNYILKSAILSFFIDLLKYVVHINEITPFLIVIAHKNNGISLTRSSAFGQPSWKYPLSEAPLAAKLGAGGTDNFIQSHTVNISGSWVCKLLLFVLRPHWKPWSLQLVIKFQRDLFFCGCIENLNQMPSSHRYDSLTNALAPAFVNSMKVTQMVPAQEESVLCYTGCSIVPNYLCLSQRETL